MTEPSIPAIPFSGFHTDFAGFSQAIGASFARYGFVVLADHGLPQERIDAALATTKAFFALPEATKRTYVVGEGGQRGYTPFGVETAKDAAHHDLKEFWHTGREPSPGSRRRDKMTPNVWPRELPAFRQEISWLYAALDGVGLKVLEAIAVYLGLRRGFFQDAVEEGNSVLRLLHYPPADFAGSHIRAGAHEDINVVTLLLGAEEAGLEVLDRDGRWLAINPPPGAMVLNIGDMLQRLTNHRLPSTTHRVVNPSPERRGVARFSTPFFLHFNPDYEIVTLPVCVDADHPDRYPTPITADEFLRQRLREIKLL